MNSVLLASIALGVLALATTSVAAAPAIATRAAVPAAAGHIENVTYGWRKACYWHWGHYHCSWRGHPYWGSYRHYHWGHQHWWGPRHSWGGSSRY